MHNLAFLPAHELARLIRQNLVSSYEVFNLTGSPAMALPFGLTKDGLPMGVQLVGRRWQDMELLVVAEAIAQVSGPFQAPPGYEDNDD